MNINTTSLDTLCVALCEIMGVNFPENAASLYTSSQNMPEDLNIVHLYKAYPKEI